MKFKKLSSVFLAVLLSASAVNSPDLVEEKALASSEVWFSGFDKSVNNGEPIRGADISSVISLEKAGVKFRNEQGEEQDIFRTLAENSVNYIRVRVWNNPYDDNGNSYGGGNNDVWTAGEIGRRAAEYNMKLLVDIQYSDFWADPEKQTRPKYWKDHDTETLKTEIYKYTQWVLQSVSDAGADIGMVQVGNETNGFFCGESDMYKICELFAYGEKAVRDFDKNILIAHHFADPLNAEYDWYAKVMNECGLDYDVFATSYYPYWHGTTQNLTDVLKRIGNTYNKYVMVAETAYPYTSEDGDHFGNVVSAASDNTVFRYDISVEGQAQCFTDVFQAVANTGSHGIGAFYWEPAWLGVEGLEWWQNNEKWKEYGSGWATEYASEYDKGVKEAGGSSYDNQALFDFSGKPLESLKVYNNIYPRNENILPEKGSYIPEGRYRIKNLSSGLYLTVANGKGETGNNVVQYTADGAADYNTWELRETGSGYYEIYSSLSGGNTYLLDLDSGKADNKTNIGIYTNTGADAQKFKFVPAENGSYIIVTKSTKDRSAVEIADALGTDGANAQQFVRNNHSCQAWILEPVEEYRITGDLNSDGCVDVFDLVLLRKNITDSVEDYTGDTNNDGEINVSDLVTFENYLIRNRQFEKPTKGTPKNTVFPKI